MSAITTPSNYNFFTDTGHRLGLFTAEGQSRSCDINVRTGNEITVQSGQALSKAQLSAKCSSPSFLIDTFDTSYHFLGEYRSEIIGDGMVAGSNQIWQIYCCPYHACTSNAGCTGSYGNTCNINYGSCYSTLPTHSTSILKCVNNAWVSQGTATYGQTHFCSMPSQTDYIDNSGSEHCAITPDASWCAPTTTNTTTACTNYSHSTKAICESHGCSWSGIFSGNCGVNGTGTENATNENPTIESITWSKYYSTSDASFVTDNHFCFSNSDCSAKEGYTVTCLQNDKIKQRIWDGTKAECKESQLNSHGLIFGFIKFLKNILVDPCAYRADLSQFITSVFKGEPGVCIAESNGSFGKLWDGVLKTVGGLGLPTQWVLLITIALLFLIASLLIGAIK